MGVGPFLPALNLALYCLVSLDRTQLTRFGGYARVNYYTPVPLVFLKENAYLNEMLYVEMHEFFVLHQSKFYSFFN